MSLIGAAVKVLNAGMKRVGGETVTYRAGNDSIDGLVVVPLNTGHDGYGDGDVQITSLDRDWLVWQQDLAIGGKLVEPQQDHELDWIDPSGVKRTFIVRSRGNDDRPFRHTDQTLQQLRVYTTESKPNIE